MVRSGVEGSKVLMNLNASVLKDTRTQPKANSVLQNSRRSTEWSKYTLVFIES